MSRPIEKKQNTAPFIFVHFPYIKFQDPISKLPYRVQRLTDGQIDKQAQVNMPPQLLWSRGHKKGNKSDRYSQNFMRSYWDHLRHLPKLYVWYQILAHVVLQLFVHSVAFLHNMPKSEKGDN